MKIKNIFYAMRHPVKYVEFVKFKFNARKELGKLNSTLAEVEESQNRAGLKLDDLSTSISDLKQEAKIMNSGLRQTRIELDRATQRLANFGNYLDEVESQANKSYERAVRR